MTGSEQTGATQVTGRELRPRDEAAGRVWDIAATVNDPEVPVLSIADLGIPTGALAKTLDRYNEHAARGEDPDFHKHPDWLAAQDQGPWGAYDLSLGKALYAGFTLGGLRTSVDGQVRRADGSAVPGLYAAGACASNIAQDGAGYCSGTQLGEGSFFGRRAGRHAALG